VKSLKAPSMFSKMYRYFWRFSTTLTGKSTEGITISQDDFKAASRRLRVADNMAWPSKFSLNNYKKKKKNQHKYKTPFPSFRHQQEQCQPTNVIPNLCFILSYNRNFQLFGVLRNCKIRCRYKRILYTLSVWLAQIWRKTAEILLRVAL
jgi:hypothetical protein